MIKMELATFLKKHSSISNEFIERFLSMYDPQTTQTDCVIELDVVAKWLHVRKENLVKTLKSGYRKNVDYKFELVGKKTNTRYGGNNRKKYLITPDCFKRLCMRSTSYESENVRSYFISLESLIVKYKDHMLAGMQQEIKQLEKNQMPKSVEDSAGYIYVFRASPTRNSVYKIGRTSNLVNRLRTYQTGHADDDIDLIYKYRTDNHKTVEGCLKTMLKEKQYRKYKEVYEVDIDIIKQLIKECDGVATIKTELFKAKRVKTQKGAGYEGLYAALVKDD